MPNTEAPKKTLYHSELVRANGPVELTVESDPLESKKKKGEYYFIVTLDGRQRYLMPENEDCLEFFNGQKGQTLSVIAEGRGEDAKSTYVGAPADDQPAQSPNRTQQQKPPAQTQQAHRSPQQQNGNRPAQAPVNGDGLKAAKVFVAHNESLMKIGLSRMTALATEYGQATGCAMSEVLKVAVLNGLLFGASSAGIVAHLPTRLDYNTLTEAQ